MARLTAAPRFLRVTEFLEMTGMSRSFIFAQMVEGAFPKHIHLGPRTIALNKREVVLWMEAGWHPNAQILIHSHRFQITGSIVPPPFKMFSKGLLILW